MALDLLNVGTAADDGSGDSLRAAGLKINAEFRRVSVSPEKLDATGDGVTVDSVNFQAAATAAAGGTLTLTPGKTYLVANISIPANTQVDMRGATVKLAPLSASVGSPIFVCGGNNIFIYGGGTFDGNKAAQSADGFHDSYNSGTNGKGRAYRAAVIAESRTDIKVAGCHFKDTYGAAVATQNCDGVSIYNNTSAALNFELAFVATTAGGHTDVLITGNRGKDFASGDATVNANAVLVAQGDRTVIADNIFHNCERTHIKCEGGNHIAIGMNVLTTNTLSGGWPAITVQSNNATDVSIIGNTMANVGSGMLLSSPSLKGLVVVGNSINTTNGSSGADAIQLTNTTTLDDALIACNQGYDIKRIGVYISQGIGNRVTIANNIFYGQGVSTQQGLYVNVNTGWVLADLKIIGNHLENFVETAVDDGVLTLWRDGTGSYTRLIVQGNTLLAGGSANRAIVASVATGFISSGIVADNYVEGVGLGTHAGLVVRDNTVTGTSFLVGGGAGTQLSGSATYDPASLADGAGATTTVTVTGAALGDYAEASFSLDLQSITLTAWVSAADTVSVRFQNESGGTLNLASGTLRARVCKA